MELLIQGILLGGLYATAALGLSLVFGTMRVVNLAHGEFLILGAYLTSVIISAIGGDPLLIALPAAIVLALLVYPLQRYVITPVMSHGEEAPIIATFGVSVAIQTVLLLLFTSNPLSLSAPYTTTQVEIFGVGMRTSLLIALAIGIVMVVLLWFVLRKTPFGRKVRAASIDPEAAGLVGIDVKRTYARVMSIAAVTAAIGGVLIALSFSVAPSSGTGWLLRAFTVVVIGGLGSIPGTLLGAFLVALVETFGSVILGPEYRDVIVFGVLVVVLLVRPNGLFSKVSRA